MKTAIICIKDERISNYYSNIVYYAVQMTKACCEKGINPLGSIVVGEKSSELFNLLGEVAKKVKKIDYVIIYSREQMGLDPVHSFILSNNIQENLVQN
ncbi:MAG: hypothetical protein MJ194_03435 [Clostridia bacterium]|nr:hypothetical protein [Clostridia bacterium]